VRLRPHGRFGLYELESRVSEGGLGEVWKAHHTTSARHVALRILPSPPPDDPFRFARFEHDVSKLTSLRHVNIAKAYELLDVDSVRALVFEWVSGESLASRLASEPIPIDEAVQLIEQVAKGLAAAHARDLIHGDVKPSNIVLCPNGTVKILDLGLIEIYEPGAPAQPEMPPAHSARLLSAITGTAAYFSPEQILGCAADSRSDVWAFGCVLYEILTGRPAFSADDLTDTMTLVSGAEPEWTLIPATTPAPLVDVLRGCLKKDAAQRFQRMTDVLAPFRVTMVEEESPHFDITPDLTDRAPDVRRSVLHSVRDEMRGRRRWLGEDLDRLDEHVRAEATDEYEEALEQLDERDRALVKSRIKELESYDDIATRFSFPNVSAARMAVRRAIVRLVELMAKIKKRG
jgi:serine/threonine protein kinase